MNLSDFQKAIADAHATFAVEMQQAYENLNSRVQMARAEFLGDLDVLQEKAEYPSNSKY